MKVTGENNKKENQIGILKKEITSLKSNLSELYTSIGDYTLHIIFEISSLRGVLSLYSDYYCSTEIDAPNTLLNELVANALTQLGESVTHVARMMNESGILGDTIAQENSRIEDAHKSLAEIIDSLKQSLKFFDSSKDVSLSIKDCESRISVLVGEYARNRNAFSSLHEKTFSDNGGIIPSLEDECRKMKGSVSRKISGAFEYVRGIGKKIDEVEALLEQIVISIQNEDIVRQNMEKTLFWIEEVVERSDAVYADLHKNMTLDELNQFAMSVVSERFVRTQQGIDSLLKSSEECFLKTKAVIDQMCGLIRSNERRYSSRYFFDMICEVYDRLANIEQAYLSQLEYVIGSKTLLHDYLHKVVKGMRNLDGILSSVSEISDHLAVSESGVDETEEAISFRRFIQESCSVFRESARSMGVAAMRYHLHLSGREKPLQKALFLIRRLTIQLRESMELHSVITDEIFSKTESINKFVESEEDFLHVLSTARDSMLSPPYEAFHSKQILDSAAVGENYRREIVLLRDHFAGKQTSGNYRNMMIVSLLNEYIQQKSGDTILF